MEIIILPSGEGRCVYSEAIDLNQLGSLSIRRGSHVEPNDQGQWMADLSPVDGPRLGPFDNRSKALAAELSWLNLHWLMADNS
ncbi:hypothetical protein Q31b_47280 [Novipirellula aureliae]|uniref:Uncharacterized protein n=1 Tax=Novipirellula aureliae TaxID=2527966 RepID=A0A5C6DT59_9BACT|nr:hypothetical protein [Novipirellula aureliae]TWU37939.1 hypothetical protein Q31b_47280 [Novipirellula aureliae]